MPVIKQIKKGTESGATLLEFTFVAVTFFMMLLAITSGANMYFTHNALVEATRLMQGGWAILPESWLELPGSGLRT